MSLLKKISSSLAITVLALALTHCNHSQADKNTIKVGTIAGPETELMEVAKRVAKNEYNLKIEIVPFTDYNMPNDALDDGSIDANMFQHQPFLDAATKARGYKIVSVGKTFIYPMGAYSKKITRLDQLKEGALVAIPNDPSNEARALLLLEKAGLISLKPGAGDNATIADIKTNPKQLNFRELDAAQLPRVLPDVDLAVINTNYAMIAGLTPSHDALITEKADSPYANIIVVRKTDVNDPRVQHLIKALHSKEVLTEANKLFKGEAVQAW